MLDVGANHRRGVLRPQRDGGAVAVLERVHFLRDDIGFLPDAAREKLRLLEDRRADFVVVVDRENLVRDPLHAVPHGRVGRQ